MAPFALGFDYRVARALINGETRLDRDGYRTIPKRPNASYTCLNSDCTARHLVRYVSKKPSQAQGSSDRKRKSLASAGLFLLRPRRRSPSPRQLQDDERASQTLDVLRDTLYDLRMIKSFRDRDTENLFRARVSKRFSNIANVAKRKLDYLDAAHVLSDLRSPPGNHLEALKGDRVGQHSIRINDQWRICFTWTEGGPADVEIVDYH